MIAEMLANFSANTYAGRPRLRRIPGVGCARDQAADRNSQGAVQRKEASRRLHS
jgi:hypothetical protein